MNEAAATVFVVEDDPAVRQRVGPLLRSIGCRVKLFASADEFLAQFDPRVPGCLVSELTLPGISGFDLQDRLRTMGDALPIVFLSGAPDVRASVRAMKAGASDFLVKPVSDQDLLDAVTAALAQDEQRRREWREADGIRSRLARLTPREREVLAHILTGALNKQIGDAMRIAEKTVKVHRGRVMMKLRARSAVELALLAQRGGLVPTERPCSLAISHPDRRAGGPRLHPGVFDR